MTPEHNMIDGTGNPPEEGTTGEGTSGTGGEEAQAPDTGEGPSPLTFIPGQGFSARSEGEKGDTTSSGERPNADGRGRGDPPQRPGDDLDEDIASSSEEGVSDHDEKVMATIQVLDNKLDKKRLSLLQETKNVDVDEISEIGIDTGFTFDEFAAHLRILGHSEDTIRELESRRSLFRDDTEVDTDPDVMDVNRDSRDMIKKLVQAKESGDEEKINAAIQEGEGFIANIKNRLFDPGTGLLREEDRGKRLFVKPIVTMLLALIISYMLALSVMTRGSTTRIGGGK